MTGSTNTSQCSQKLAKKEEFDIKPNFEDEEEIQNDSESEFDGYEEQESKLWKKRQKNVKWLSAQLRHCDLTRKKKSPIFRRNRVFFAFLSILTTGNTADDATGTGNVTSPANSEWHGSRIRVPKRF